MLTIKNDLFLASYLFGVLSLHVDSVKRRLKTLLLIVASFACIRRRFTNPNSAIAAIAIVYYNNIIKMFSQRSFS